ncbi:MAG: tyrosine--tRNA ligase [Candidatus Margulisiibacteriota bacterium]
MDKRLSQFLRGLSDIIPENLQDLILGKPLKIKWGADPSASDLHLGHTVVLQKLRLLQELGHQVIFLIGDFTAMIGDPTGKSETRKVLSLEAVQANAKTYQDQVFKILDPAKTTVVFNSEWLNALSGQDMIGLAGKYTVARMLEREDFHNRFQGQQAISIHEFLYPLLQGYDSVVLENDIEMGGTDQKFNLLMGRHLQKEYGKKPQGIFTVPILEGLDGVQKMSKSLHNHIAILDSPKDMFGKLMSIPDPLILRYFTLLTAVEDDFLSQMDADMKAGTLNPRDAKIDLAIRIVTQFHSAEAAVAALEEFKTIFVSKGVPTDMPIWALPQAPVRLDALLVEAGISPSKKEASRLIAQGGVSINDTKITDVFHSLEAKTGDVLKAGKRHFLKLEVTP